MQKKFEIVSKNRKFQGHFAIDVYKVRYEKFEGGFTPIIQREVFERGSAAGVLPYDPVRQEVVLIEQFRVGAVNNTKKTPWLFETVAGIIEEGETVEEVIHREAEEEAGLKIQKLIPKNAFVVVLDEKGKELGSIEFSKVLSDAKDKGMRLTFIIGGAFGLSENLKKNCNLLLSMSRMTFTHQMIRLFLLEQIYRGFCILTGKEYHY